jgi:hypothetical protein
MNSNRLFGIKLGLNLTCFSIIPPTNASKNYYSNNNSNNKKQLDYLLRKADHIPNIHYPLSHVINDFTKVLYEGFINKQSTKLLKMSKKNKTRLDNIIYYTENRYGEKRSKEYKLMRNFLLLHPELYLIAVEYEFDEGICCSVQQHGDLILFYNNIIYITECKCIDIGKVYTQKRQETVITQSKRCCERFKSWMNHIAKFDKGKEIIANMDIKPFILTDYEFKEII